MKLFLLSISCFFAVLLLHTWPNTAPIPRDFFHPFLSASLYTAVQTSECLSPFYRSTEGNFIFPSLLYMSSYSSPPGGQLWSSLWVAKRTSSTYRITINTAESGSIWSKKTGKSPSFFIRPSFLDMDNESFKDFWKTISSLLPLHNLQKLAKMTGYARDKYWKWPRPHRVIKN